MISGELACENLLRTLLRFEKKYRSHREGSIRLTGSTITSIKCPRSFKCDSFVDIPCNEHEE